jgi:hypothetical protein
MIVNLVDVAGSTVLAGATAGAQSLAKLISLVRAKASEVVYLDFSGADAATGSFLRECIVGFRNYCRRVQPDIYPVIANAAPVIEEEFRDLLLLTSDAFVACRVSKSGRVSGGKVLGHLDQRQIETLQAVLSMGDTTATGLSGASKEKVGVTAWNNRLAALVSKGVLSERKTGRLKTYSPVIKELHYGS